jgi:hypothetical protein
MLLERPRSLSTDGHCAIAFPFPPAKRFVPLHHASTGTGAGPNGGGWSFFVCPACGRRARVLNHDKYAVDARGLGYSYAYIALKRLGVGQYYLINIKDKDGEAYDGAKTYRLHVPPNVPVEQYWSVTAYDRETHALIKGVDRVSRASNAADLEKNDDGSVDVWFGPKAPEGKQTNWVPTDPDRLFELMFRLYAPTKALFDKAWTLPNVEKAAP